MLETILTRKIIIACFAVALGWTFPWKPIQVQLQIDHISYEIGLELFFNQTSYIPESTSNLLNTLWNISTTLIIYNNVSIGYLQGYLIGYIIGFAFGWPIADKFGRRNGIIYASAIRLIGTLLLFLHEFEANTHLLLTLGFTLGLYHGLLFSIGYMYIYELSPKYSTSQINLAALPVLAIYFLSKYSMQYILSLVNLLPYSFQTNYLMILLSFIAGFVQVAILFKFCLETPSFMIIQRREFKQAKQRIGIILVLRQLRQTRDIIDEFKEIKWDRPQHESMKRTSYILMLYMFGVLYHYILLQIGYIHWIIHGVPFKVVQAIYFVLTVISFLFATFNYGRSTLAIPETKKLMFRAYSFFSIFIILTCILFLLKFHYSSHFIIDCILVIISMIATVVFYSGPTVITTVLILDYPKQACRGNHFVLCVLFAFILVIMIVILFCITLGFIFIVIGKLNIYIVTAFTAAYFCFLVWLVWVKEGKLDLKDDNDDDSENISDDKEKGNFFELAKNSR